MSEPAMSEESDGAATADELPHPDADPTLKYCHEGKRYDIFGRDRQLEVVEYVADGPAGGVVVIDFVDADDQPLHEPKRDDSGISRDALAPYIDEYGDDGGVITANCLLRELRELNIGEVDVWSYADLYHERVEE